MPARNTDLADVNEIYTAFVLNGNKYPDSASESQFNKKLSLLTPDQAADQMGRAKSMADEFLKWARNKGYGSSIKKVYWTARPGFSFKPIVGYDVDQRKNPADVLVDFGQGKYLGLSAKSTKGKGDIGFKNPGVGTIEKDLSIKLKPIADKATESFIEKYNLPKAAAARKQEIRKNPLIKKSADEEGSSVLNEMRESYLKKINSLTDKQRKEYIINSWIDASDELKPPYIKVTGKGTKGRYTANAEDPLNNEKLIAINTSKITFESVGNDSVGVKAGSKKIMKMRFKFESEKLSSSLKMSGDPW